MADPTTPHKVRNIDGFGESWDRDRGGKAQVLYEVDWASRYDLVKEVIGGFDAGSNGFGQWKPPHAFPPSPNLYALAIGEIKGQGLLKSGGADNKWAPFAKALVPVEYGVPTFPVSPDDTRGQFSDSEPTIPGAEVSIKNAASFRTLPEGKLKFSSSGKSVDSDVGIPEPVEEISLTFKNMPFNPYAWVYPYIGTVNYLPIFGHAKGEVLFDSIEVSYSGNVFSVGDMTARLSFLSRVSVARLGSAFGPPGNVTRTTLDWNKILNDTGSYEFVEFVNGGGRVFRYSDFWQMLTGSSDGIATIYST